MCAVCGRFALDEKVNDSITEFVEFAGLRRLAEWQPNWNIRPTDPIVAVIDSPRSGLVADVARWSLVPAWSRELRLRFPTFNARAESAAVKPSFRDAVKRSRALIPATGYFEWLTELGPSGRAVKSPHFVRSTEGPVMFAGLFSWWRDRSKADDDESRWVLTATILTMDAPPRLSGLHPRSPVVLPRDWWSAWLDSSVVGDQGLVDAAVAAATPVADSLEFFEVGPVRGNGPGLVEPR